jgi:hypothetical protein
MNMAINIPNLAIQARIIRLPSFLAFHFTFFLAIHELYGLVFPSRAGTL